MGHSSRPPPHLLLLRRSFSEKQGCWQINGQDDANLKLSEAMSDTLPLDYNGPVDFSNVKLSKRRRFPTVWTQAAMNRWQGDKKHIQFLRRNVSWNVLSKLLQCLIGDWSCSDRAHDSETAGSFKDRTARYKNNSFALVKPCGTIRDLLTFIASVPDMNFVCLFIRHLTCACASNGPAPTISQLMNKFTCCLKYLRKKDVWCFLSRNNSALVCTRSSVRGLPVELPLLYAHSVAYPNNETPKRAPTLLSGK